MLGCLFLPNEAENYVFVSVECQQDHVQQTHVVCISLHYEGIGYLGREQLQNGSTWIKQMIKMNQNGPKWFPKRMKSHARNHETGQSNVKLWIVKIILCASTHEVHAGWKTTQKDSRIATSQPHITKKTWNRTRHYVGAHTQPLHFIKRRLVCAQTSLW